MPSFKAVSLYHPFFNLSNVNRTGVYVVIAAFFYSSLRAEGEAIYQSEDHHTPLLCVAGVALLRLFKIT